MKLTFRNGRFVFLCHYNFRDTAKAAGFRWDPQKKEWWSDNWLQAARLKKYADSAAQEELAQREQKIAESRSSTADIQIPAPEGLQYYPFQVAGIKYMLSRRHVLLADEMGLGKTPMSIGVINIERPKRVVIVVPNILKLNWQLELQRWLLHPYNIYTVNSNDPFDFTDDMIVIVNYERIIKQEVLTQLQRPFDLLIIDECHKVKNSQAQRTQVLISGPQALLTYAAKALFLTGSPMPNRPIELFPLLHALNPERWQFWPFVKRYCGAYRNAYGAWCFDRATNLAELHTWLRENIMLRRTKSDVLPELPEKRHQMVVFESKVVEELLAEESKSFEQFAIDSTKINSLEEVIAWKTMLRKLTTSPIYGHLMKVRHTLGLAKVPFVVEHLNNFFEDSNSKVVLFAHHRDVLENIHRAFSGSVLVYGGTTDAERQKAIERFQNDPDCRLFCGNMHVSGVGLTLTAADTVMFAELDFVPGNMLQAEDRCHRIGQRNSVLVQYLVFDKSVDVNIAWMLVHKRRWIAQLLDIAPKVKEQELSCTI